MVGIVLFTGDATSPGEENDMFTANELKVSGEATINDIDYIILDDGCYTNVYRKDDVDFSEEYGDYNDFCQAVDAEDDEEIIALVCAAADVKGAYTAGSCCWVDAAKDAELEDEDEDAEDDE